MWLNRKASTKTAKNLMLMSTSRSQTNRYALFDPCTCATTCKQASLCIGVTYFYFFYSPNVCRVGAVSVHPASLQRQPPRISEPEFVSGLTGEHFWVTMVARRD